MTRSTGSRPETRALWLGAAAMAGVMLGATPGVAQESVARQTLAQPSVTGCSGVALTLEAAGAVAPWSIDVPFDKGVATVSGAGGDQGQLVVHESCSPRRITFDLAAGPRRPAGRCSIVVQGSDASGGCVIDGREEEPVSGIVRRPPSAAMEETSTGSPAEAFSGMNGPAVSSP